MLLTSLVFPAAVKRSAARHTTSIGASRLVSNTSVLSTHPDPPRQHTKRAAPPLPALTSLAAGASAALGTALGYFYITDTRASVHRRVVVPALRLLCRDAEDAHHAGVAALRVLHNLGLHPREREEVVTQPDLRTEVFGYVLDNAIGTSAGVDKDADVPCALLALGPALVEIGGATPLPQEGNPRPRVFRVPSQEALVNRYGLNSRGADYVADQLRRRVRKFARSSGFGSDEEAERRVLDGEADVPPGSLVAGKLLAVQVAKNKATPDGDIEAVRRDYARCVERLARYADVITVNVSSPNTPGLRGLQQKEPLKYILRGVVDAAHSIDRKTKPAVMVKVSPDEDTEDDVLGICQAVWASGADGVVVGNTTKRRPDPSPAGFVFPAHEAKMVREQGGYSGPQTFERTVLLVKRYRQMLDEAIRVYPDQRLKRKVIFASGGITDGKRVLKVLDAGASVAQVYTAMIYSGVGTITRIKDEMRTELLMSQKEQPQHSLE